jgi:hypothetical protein
VACPRRSLGTAPPGDAESYRLQRLNAGQKHLPAAYSRLYEPCTRRSSLLLVPPALPPALARSDLLRGSDMSPLRSAAPDLLLEPPPFDQWVPRLTWIIDFILFGETG